jgi:hypothetical protein
MRNGLLAWDLDGDDPLRGSLHALNLVRAFRIYTPPLPRMPAARGVLSLSLASVSSESDSTDAGKSSSSSMSVLPITDHAIGDEGASEIVEALQRARHVLCRIRSPTLRQTGNQIQCQLES